MRMPETYLAADPRGHSPRFSPQPVIIGFVLIVCLALVGLDTLRSWNERSATLANGRAESENLARSVAQQADDTLRAANITILGMIERIDHDGTGPDQLDRLQTVMTARMG